MAESSKTGVAGAAVARIGLGAIFASFFRLGCTSFGGGTAGWIHREIVIRRRWVDDQSFLAALSLGQALPGANGIKTAALLGQGLRGAAGALCAVLGLLAGPFVIVLTLGGVYAGIGGNRVLEAVLDGIAAAAIGLTFATGLHTVRLGTSGIGPLAITAATVFSVGVLRWPMVLVIAALAPISIGLALAQGRRGR